MKKQKPMFEKFSFAILENGLDGEEISVLKDIIAMQGGTASTVVCPMKQTRKKKYDFLIIQPNQSPSQIRQLLPKTVQYEEPPVSYKYIYECLSEGKMISKKKFMIKDEVDENKSGKKRVKKSDEESDGTQKIESEREQDNIGGKKKDITAPPLNKYIIDELQKLLKVYSNEGDKGRKIAYSRAISSLKGYTKEIRTNEDIQELAKTQNHIGPKLVDKMKQLLQTGHIGKLQTLKNTDKNLAADELTRVWGIGSAKAKQLYSKGIKSIQQLRKIVEVHPDVLTKNQKIGLKYLEDLEVRIPREKVTQMFSFVKEQFYELVGSKDSHEIQICGSYRRGKQTCGDMDIFITRKNGQFQKKLLTQFANKLEKKGFLTDHLTMPRHTQAHSCQSYMGVCKYKTDVHHRIDIKYYPVEQFAFAVLYFTGSDSFNRQMRLQAMNQGYHLSDHGIYKANKEGTKVTAAGPNIKCETQKQIFALLNIEYKTPQERSL